MLFPISQEKLLKNGESSLAAYQAEINNNVMILITLHRNVNVELQDKKKLSERIGFYDKIK